LVQPLDLELLKLKSSLKRKSQSGVDQIFDPVRKKWLVVTPEELVRQLLIIYLNKVGGYSLNKMGVEKMIEVVRQEKRFDIVVYSDDYLPFLVVECKAPGIPISQKVMDQAAIYNIALKAPFLLISNGMVSLCCKIDRKKGAHLFLNEVPRYGEHAPSDK